MKIKYWYVSFAPWRIKFWKEMSYYYTNRTIKKEKVVAFAFGKYRGNMKFDWFDWCAVAGISVCIAIGIFLFQAPRGVSCYNTINKVNLEKCR